MKSFLAAIVRECLFLLGIWRPRERSELKKAVSNFIDTNRPYWGRSVNRFGNVLVEGHLSEYGPNYLFRTAVAAKAIEFALGGASIDVVVSGYSYQWQRARDCYRSFGITRWIFLGRKFLLLSPILQMLSLAWAAWQFLNIKSPVQILEIHFGKIKVGDLIYDEVLRATKLPTVHSMDIKVFRVLVRAWGYYLQYHLLFRLRNYRYYVSTHTAYPEYGLLCRVALQRGVTVIETSDIQMSVYRNIGERELPTYHQGINSAIRAELAHSPATRQKLEHQARESLRRRLESEISQIDAKRAYSGKVYDRASLAAALDLAPDARFGFVLAHIFTDSPHLSSAMLHADYYQWLVATIECCAEAKDIVWIFKPHPSCALYGEDGKVEALVRKKGARNIYICPADLNTSSLANCADVILTVHGTAGLEYSCLGIPTILAGTPFYAGFGFTQEPQSTSDYDRLVRQASTLPRLTPQQIAVALQVFAIWENQFDWDNNIITTEILASVWGNDAKRDLVRAYTLLAQNIRSTDPRTMKLWGFVCSVLRDDLARNQ